MTTPAYQTHLQELYFGDADDVRDLSSIVNAVNIPSQVTTIARVVLGRSYPSQRVARVDYRLTCPQMLVGAETDYMAANPRQIVLLVQTDSNKSMSFESVVSGIPENAAAQGEIIANVTFQPRGIVYESDGGRELPTSIATGDLLYVVDSARYTASGTTTNLSAGLHVIGAGVSNVNATGRGRVFARTRVSF